MALNLFTEFGAALVQKEGGWLCHYCGRRVERLVDQNCPYKATCDHIIAIANGGRTEVDNLVLCCKECNIKKGTGSYLEYWRKMATLRMINGIRTKRKRKTL